MLEELLLAERGFFLLLGPVLWCVPDQDDQHGLTGHVHLEHTAQSRLHASSVLTQLTKLNLKFKLIERLETCFNLNGDSLVYKTC